MGLDLRWPIGLMFSLIGALLVIAGLVKGAEAQIDLWWGLVLLAFGAFMLFMARRAKSAADHNKPPKH